MIFKNEIITIIVRFITIIIGFSTSIITARYLGPDGRGDYFFVTTLVLLLTQFANLGLSSSNTYLVANDTELLNKLIANSFWVSIVVGSATSICALLIFHLLHIDISSGAWTLVLLVPAAIFYLLGTNLLVGINKIPTYNFFQIISNVQLVILIALAGILGYSTNGFLVFSMFGWILIVVGLLISLRKYVKPSKFYFQFDKNSFLQGIPYGIKAYLVTLIGMLVLKGNILILKYFTDDTVLGYYSIASQLNDCLGVLPASIGLVLFPNLIRNTRNKWSEMTRSLLLSMSMMLIACILGAILVKPFITLAYGELFLPAVNVFWCILPGAFFLGVIVIISQYLAAIGFPKELIMAWGIAFLVMLLSSLILIPYYGAEGAAMSLSLTYVVLFFLICFVIKINKKGV